MSTTTTTFDRLVTVELALAAAAKVPEVARIAKLEVRLRELWWAAWVKRARAAATAGSSATTEAALVSAVDRHMRGWAAEVQPSSKRIVGDIYRLSREAAWKKATGQARGSLQYDTEHMEGEPITKARGGVSTSFSVEDQNAIAALERDVMVWTGRHYDENVRGALRENASEIMVRGGQDRTRAGVDIRDRIERELGHATTPTGWRGSQAAYFESLAANTATVGRVNGALTSFRRAGITRYEIVNPTDERTCPVCSHMDGKVFTVGQGEAVAGAVAEAETPDDVRVAHPWLRSDALRSISPKAGYQGGGDARSLAAAGFALPPFHFRCRCTINVSDEAMFDPGPPIDDKLYDRGRPERAKIPRTRTPSKARTATAPREVVDPEHKPAFAGYPRGDATVPNGPFDPEKMAAALARGDEAEIRRQLNNLSDERGLVNHDFIQKRSNRARYEVAPKDIDANAAAFHDGNGRIGVTAETHAEAKSFARKLANGTFDQAEGEDVLEMWGFKTLVHENVHAHSPIMNTTYSRAGLWIEEATTELTARRIVADKFGVMIEIVDASESYQPVIDTLIATVGKAAKVGDDLARELVEAAGLEMRRGIKIHVAPDAYLKHFVASIPDEALGLTAAEAKAFRSRLVKDLKRTFDDFEL